MVPSGLDPIEFHKNESSKHSFLQHRFTYLKDFCFKALINVCGLHYLIPKHKMSGNCNIVSVLFFLFLSGKWDLRGCWGHQTLSSWTLTLIYTHVRPYRSFVGVMLKSCDCGIPHLQLYSAFYLWGLFLCVNNPRSGVNLIFSDNPRSNWKIPGVMPPSEIASKNPSSPTTLWPEILWHSVFFILKSHTVFREDHQTPLQNLSSTELRKPLIRVVFQQIL